MFRLGKDKICFSDGTTQPVNVWLCKRAQSVKAVFEMLSEDKPSDSISPIFASVKDGKLWFDTEDDVEIAKISFAYVKNHGISVLKCVSCGDYFAPKKRADEKYCSLCRDGGALKTFREKALKDEMYVLFTKFTKHLRYLKSKGILSESAYSRQYKEAKNTYNDFKNGTISELVFREKMGSKTEVQGQSNIESYLL